MKRVVIFRNGSDVDGKVCGVMEYFLLHYGLIKYIILKLK